MKFASLAFASLALLAQAQAPADINQPANYWASVWAKVPEPMKTALANTPLVSNQRPPMEILVKPPARNTSSDDEAGSGSEGTERAQIAGGAQQEQVLEPKALFSGKAFEVYSRMQAKTLGGGLVSPSGASLKFNNLWRWPPVVTRQGLITREDLGAMMLADAKGTKWALPFKVVGPTPGKDWMTEPAFSEECQKLQGFILAGDWPKAFDPSLRKTARKTSPNEPLLLALDILAALDQPAGKEAQIQEAAAKLSALLPRNPGALSLCAAAYLATGKPEFAGRLRAWISEMKLVTH